MKIRIKKLSLPPADDDAWIDTKVGLICDLCYQTLNSSKHPWSNRCRDWTRCPEGIRKKKRLKQRPQPL